MSSGGLETGGGNADHEGTIFDAVVPLTVLVVLCCSVSYVSFKMWNHYYRLTLGYHFDPLKVLGLLCLCVSGGGVTFLFLTSQDCNDYREAMDMIMKKPLVVGGILGLSAIIPIVENYVHPSN